MPPKVFQRYHLVFVILLVILIAGVPLLSPTLSLLPMNGSTPNTVLPTSYSTSRNHDSGSPVLPGQPLLADTPLENRFFGELLVVYGDHVNESGQEPVSAWISLFSKLGFNASSIHLSMVSNISTFDVLVVTPSVGISGIEFGVSLADAQRIGTISQPILLLGYAHEILDQLAGFNPITDFIPSLERYLWSSDSSLQIFTNPTPVAFNMGRCSLYNDHVLYDAYRVDNLPSKGEVLGTNHDESGAQILWYRAVTTNPHIYYWGIDQVTHLNEAGRTFCQNLLLWLLRRPLQKRLGTTLAAFQLFGEAPLDYWQMQGHGGFGYPLEPSLRFTYYVADMAVSFGLDVNTTAFGPWLHQTYNSTLGCFEDLATPQLQDRCLTTSMAVLTARHLGILPEFDTLTIGHFLASCQDAITGGFFTEPGAPTTSLATTRFAVKALNAIGQLNKINTSAVVAYVRTCQELQRSSPEYGGFFSTSSGEIVASLVHAQHAVAILHQFGVLHSINITALLTFLTRCEEPNDSGIFDTQLSMSRDEWVLGTTLAMQILTLLGETGQFNITNSRIFLIANQFSNGGWGRGDTLHDFHNSPDETWWVTQGLMLTGGLTSTEEDLRHYLTSCCTPWGGATEPLIFGDFLTGTHIISALAQVDALSIVNLTAYLEYLENCWSTPRTSFTAHQMPLGVGTDTDTPTPDRIAIEAGTFGPLYHYTFAQLREILHLTSEPWDSWTLQIRQEIEACQTSASGYAGMFGLHHLYIGRETDYTFRFDTTCWSLLAHHLLGGQIEDLANATSAREYLLSCLQGNGTHQYFHDVTHTIPLPDAWRAADEYLAETWLGLQALAYLDPGCSGVDGQRLATYASQLLLSNLTLINAYYTTHILYLLAETGLNPNAPSLLNRTALKTFLLNTSTYQGLLKDPNLPSGKWLPYLVNLAVKLTHRLNLYAHLDCNPLIIISDASYPTGQLTIGDPVSFSATITETRWNLHLTNLTVTANIFETTLTNSCDMSGSSRWSLQHTIPAKTSALGPQNLSLIAQAPRALFHSLDLFGICEVWGNITLQASYTPGLDIPRSSPLNISVDLTLTGATGIDGALTTGTVSIIVETDPTIYLAAHQALGRYSGVIPTDQLVPDSYLLFVNASAPYCTSTLTTDLLTVLVFDTSLTIEQILPLIPILDETVYLRVGLWNDSGTPISGAEVQFNITGPGDVDPVLTLTNSTNTSGIVLCSWTPDRVGQWQITYSFKGHRMYASCAGVTTLNTHRRPLACVIQLLPNSTLLIGNRSYVQVEVTDDLNGSRLEGILIGLYEGTILLDTAFTNEHGIATCEWVTAIPLGYRHLRIEITETTTHDRWISSDLQVLIQDSTTLSILTSSPQLYLGEALDISVMVTAAHTSPPNGTASLYWDGHWRFDLTITQGIGNLTLPVSYSETAGTHLIIVMFGHRETPDIYIDSTTKAPVEVLAVITPTLTLTADPLEVDNPFLTPTITIEAHLTYTNGTGTHGFIATIKIRLHNQEGNLIASFSILSDSQGFAVIDISTPQPGLYTISGDFSGDQGFAPCSHSTPLLVRIPTNPMSSFFSPIILVSLAILGLGVLLGSLGFFLLRKRYHKILDSFTPPQEIQTNTNQPSPDPNSVDERPTTL